jgi:hypothetical protein
MELSCLEISSRTSSLRESWSVILKVCPLLLVLVKILNPMLGRRTTVSWPLNSLEKGEGWNHRDLSRRVFQCKYIDAGIRYLNFSRFLLDVNRIQTLCEL